MEEQQTPAYGAKPREATWAIFCHLSALASFIVPFGNILGPLLVWLARRDVDPKAREHGKASLNFQLTITLIGTFLVVGVVIFIATGTAIFATVMGSGASGGLLAALAANWGFALFIALVIAAFAVLNILMIVINSVRAYDGREPSYWPMFRFVK